MPKTITLRCLVCEGPLPALYQPMEQSVKCAHCGKVHQVAMKRTGTTTLQEILNVWPQVKG